MSTTVAIPSPSLPSTLLRSRREPGIPPTGLGATVGRLSGGAVHILDRAHLRDLRAAELAAWQSADRTEELLERHTLGLERHWALPEDRMETGLLKLLFAASLGAIAYTVATAFQWLEHWPAFVEMVRHSF